MQGLPELHEEWEGGSPSVGGAGPQRRASATPGGDASERGAPAPAPDGVKTARAPRTQPGARKARGHAEPGDRRKETVV